MYFIYGVVCFILGILSQLQIRMSSPTGTVFNVSLFQEIEYRKIPKTSLSVYKPLPIEAPQIGNAKIPPIISPLRI